MRITIIGHSTVLIEAGGMKLLTDPYYQGYRNRIESKDANTIWVFASFDSSRSDNFRWAISRTSVF